MSSHLKAELAATCSTLGRLHKGEYLIEPECIESVKDLIRYLKRDDESHEIRRFLGESKVLQNDLIHIVKSCSDEMADLFDVTLRLLINLTTPTMLFYGEEVPAEKTGRNIYLSLIDYNQDYKIAFCDVEFWNKICGKLTNLFETDWTERSADDGIQIERMLMLLRNVLQVPANVENEKRPDNDITIHDKVLWALRQSQILELLLFVSSNKNEEQYFLNLLEIFSLILREQNPKLLAHCDITRSTFEKTQDSDELVKAREIEKRTRNKYLNMRNFNATFVMKGIKSFSNNDIVCHKALDKANVLETSNPNKKQVRTRRNRIPVESDRMERRSTFTVRLFLKEFCLEFLNCSFNHLMGVVKYRLDSGKSLANDQTYYFWALKFFLDFATASNSNPDLVKDVLSTESFHFVQTSMENAFEHLMADKKKTVDWVKRIHLILKAYHSLLEVLLWMDHSKNPLTRSISREMKSQIFYVVEYREMTLYVLLRYDPTKFSVSYLRDLIETTHLFLKLLEDYSKQTKLVVQKVMKKKSAKKKKEVPKVETREERWEKIKDDVYDTLCSENVFPEIPPFDAALDIPIDEQKGRAMKNIQKILLEGRIKDGIGLLRSSRQVWPENDYFGVEGMSVEDETMALQEICLADLGHVETGETEKEKLPEVVEKDYDDDEGEEEEEEDGTQIVEHDFDIMDYKKRLVNKKIVEGCVTLLRNYNKNSDHTNHCVIRLLNRIGWECCMPAMLYQASLFWTLLKIMKDKTKNYNEINTFTINLLRKFRKHASANPIVFLELLFWKENNVALEIQHGYEPYEKKEKPRKKKEGGKGRGRKKKDATFGEDFEMGESAETGKSRKRSKKSKKKTETQNTEVDSGNDSDEGTVPQAISNESRILFESDKSDGELNEDSKMSESDSESEEEENGVWTKVSAKSVGQVSDNNDKEQESLVADSQSKVTAEIGRRIIDSSEDEGSILAGIQRKDTAEIGRRIIDSSEDETEENNCHGDRISTTEKPIKEVRDGKESDHSSNSQASNASSKKRGRKNKIFSDDESDDNDRSQSKKLRYVGSDSDVGNWESGDEDSISIRKNRRRRLAVIDSDSDAESHNLDDNDIGSK